MKIKKKLSNLFVMNKAEQNGVVVLLAIIVLLVVFRFLVPSVFKNDTSYLEEIEQKIELIEQQENEKAQKTILNKTEKAETTSTDGKKNFSKKNQSFSKPLADIVFFEFDPNTVDRPSLIKLGFSERGADIFIKYRNSGAVFKKASDLKKVYSIDSAFYQALEPYIHIKVSDENVKTAYTPSSANKIYESRKINTIEINSADSAMWTSLPGIGPVFASRICKFRDLLGGFAKKEQLLEVYNFTEEQYNKVSEYLSLDTMLIQKININFANINDLKRHPYCNYANARAIVDYRSKNGSYRSVEQLSNDSILTTTDFLKLSNYLSID